MDTANKLLVCLIKDSGFDGEAKEVLGENWENASFEDLNDFCNDWDLFVDGLMPF